MEQFKKAIDFIKEHENDTTALTQFIEQLLCETTEEATKVALENTEYFLTILNKHK